MTIVEFLLARLADDEAQANIDGSAAMTGYAWKGYSQDAYDELQRTTLKAAKRLHAECQAKRAIIESVARGLRYDIACQEGHAAHFDAVLEHLAAVYADHPDYQEEWRPT